MSSNQLHAHLLRRLSAVSIVLCAAVQSVSAEERMSASEAAAELANPNTSLGVLAFPLDYVQYKGDLPGASDQSAWRLSFQPSLPYKLSESTNLFVRPLIPIYLDQPVPVVGGASLPPDVITDANFDNTGVQLGDIGFDVAVGKTTETGTIIIGGVVGTLPTATDDRVGLDQVLLGPEFLLGKVGKWGSVGGLLTHQWNVAGSNDADTSLTAGQYFYNINLKNAWQISATPTFSYNHEATSGNKLTLPAGIGVAKTTVIGGKPWKFALQYWHYIESPDSFGPDFQIRFQVAPVVPLPW